MQMEIHMITKVDLVPVDHLLREIDTAPDFPLLVKKLSACIADNMAVRPSPCCSDEILIS